MQSPQFWQLLQGLQSRSWFACLIDSVSRSCHDASSVKFAQGDWGCSNPDLLEGIKVVLRSSRVPGCHQGEAFKEDGLTITWRKWEKPCRHVITINIACFSPTKPLQLHGSSKMAPPWHFDTLAVQPTGGASWEDKVETRQCPSCSATKLSLEIDHGNLEWTCAMIMLCLIEAFSVHAEDSQSSNFLDQQRCSPSSRGQFKPISRIYRKFQQNTRL